jgi:hypothetical protein
MAHHGSSIHAIRYLSKIESHAGECAPLMKTIEECVLRGSAGLIPKTQKH